LLCLPLAAVEAAVAVEAEVPVVMPLKKQRKRRRKKKRKLLLVQVVYSGQRTVETTKCVCFGVSTKYRVQ
jgi:hypothetical protein